MYVFVCVCFLTYCSSTYGINREPKKKESKENFFFEFFFVMVIRTPKIHSHIRLNTDNAQTLTHIDIHTQRGKKENLKSTGQIGKGKTGKTGLAWRW